MDSRATIIFLFIVAYLIFANDTATQIRGLEARASLESAVKEAHRLLDQLGNATYGQTKEIFESTNSTDGFGHVREYAWHALPKVQARVHQHVSHALGSSGQAALGGEQHENFQLYMNVTGDARGEWARSPIWTADDVPHLNLTQYAHPGSLVFMRAQYFDRNFTKSLGHVSMAMREKGLSEKSSHYAALKGNITTVAAEMVLSEDDTEQEEEVSLRGVYFPRVGHAILTTTSSKFAGLFALPFFAASPYTFDLSRTLLNDTISRMIAEDEEEAIAAISPWGGGLSDGVQQPNAAPKCDLIVYLQQIPPSDPVQLGSLSLLDTELRFPTGASLRSIPRLHFSTVIFSPDCGYILESRGPPDADAREYDHLHGYKREVLQNRARHHMLLFALVVLLQVITLLRQMREANTPSTKSRVSFYTMAFMVFGDAWATIIFITISLFVESIWITIMSAAFFSLASMLLFGMRFLSDIWAVHAPERRRQEQEAIDALRRRRQEAFAAVRRRQQSAYNAAPTSAAEDNLASEAPVAPTIPAPPTVRAVDFGSLPLFMPSDQAGLVNDAIPRVTTFGTVYLRFSFLLIMTLFVSISAVTFPDTLRQLYFTTITLIYLSFWVPQIWRNAWRNCRCALKWEFVAGQSILRLMPIAYFFGWEGNVLFTEPHPITLSIMFAWVWIQVLMLVSQEIVGPRWFVKEAWVPAAWEYHPILQKDVEGFAMPLGLSDSDIASPTSPRLRRASIASDKKEEGTDQSGVTKHIYDCAICMQELEVPILDSSEGNKASSASYLLVRRTYMLTPCRHIFHSKCLEGWMKYRMQCPICREELPP